MSIFRHAIPGLAALVLIASPIWAEELNGTIKSVDPDAKVMVVTARDGKEVSIPIKKGLAFENARGKALKAKKVGLARIQAGGKVTVTMEKGEATKVVFGKKALAKKKKAG